MNLYIPICVFLIFLALMCYASAGDIVHQDDNSPTRPGCDNNFVLVKVPTWVDGIEDIEYVGLGARFGRTLEAKEKDANKTKLILSDPHNLCQPPKFKLNRDVILVDRGDCSFTSFTTKARIAEAANASAILIINTRTELLKMVCEANDTNVNIDIPAVMLPQDAGASLKSYMQNTSSDIYSETDVSSSVYVQLYSPERPLVDVAEVFLWLMAVGTILGASYWSAWSAREVATEQVKLLKLIYG